MFLMQTCYGWLGTVSKTLNDASIRRLLTKHSNDKNMMPLNTRRLQWNAQNELFHEVC